MLAPPSLLDRLIGNLPVYLLIWGAFLFEFVLWLDSRAHYQYLPFVLGFFVLVASNARSRVRADARWKAEKSAVLGRVAPGRSRWRYVLLVPLWAAALYVGYFFARGAIGEGEVNRWQRWALAGVADTRAYARSYATQISVRRDVQLAAGGTVALIAGGVLWRRRRRRVTSRARRRMFGGWDGTVRVMLPVPRDDR